MNWPAVLSGDEFALERQTLDRAFRTRSPGDAGTGSAFYDDVRQLTSSMASKLKEHLEDLDAAQYMTAKKFLQGLVCESKQAPVARSLAIK